MINYIIGDATLPVIKPALIIHVCNDVGKWGRGFVKALSKRTPAPESAYYAMRDRGELTLGNVEFVMVVPGVAVANMIAQRDIHPDACGTPPIRYEALAECLERVQRRLREAHLQVFTVHAPRIGCGLAGGKWSVVEPLLEHYLRDYTVYVYDLPSNG